MSDNENNEIDNTKEEQLEEQVELLSEKSVGTREIALAHINNALKAGFREDFLDDKKVTLIEAAKKGLRRLSSKDTELAKSLELLSLISFTSGVDESFYKDISPILKEIIVNHTLNDESRAATCDAFAIICFVSNDDEHETINTLDMFSHIYTERNGKSTLEAAALDAWALLVTTISNQHTYDKLIPDEMPHFFDLLKSDDVDVRVSAGECIALMYEIGQEVEGDDFDLYKFSYYANIEVNELLDTLNELAADKTKTRAKRDKLKQKAPFKDIVSTVELGEFPTETLLILHQKISFESWVQMLQLDAIRKLLGTGFQPHFQENPLMQEIFDVSLDRNMQKIQLTQVEKRKILSPNSELAKNRTRNIAEQRAHKVQEYVEPQ